MQNLQALEKINIEELIQELRERENPELREISPAFKRHVPLDDYDSTTILENIIARQKVIYGPDDRQDVFSVTDQAILKSADSVVSLWTADSVVDNGNGTSTLTTANFGTSLNLCDSEPFRNQPIGAFCSGFLVAPDIVATAGHCVDEGNVTTTRFVFGYRMINITDAKTTINNSEMYSGVSIIDRQLGTGGSDWALVRLDRPVSNHAIAPIRRTGMIPNNQAVYVVGHPSGLPIKYAPGANVRDNAPTAFFVANLDTYGGNSGSPVFNANTHEVEGILVRGENDFIVSGGCQVSMACPNTGCSGEDCTRTTQFSNLVPASGTTMPQVLLQLGVYTVQQKSTGRYVDAHESGNDFSVVTRTAQNNDTQKWAFTPVGGVYTIQQKSTDRYVDAHESGNDFSVVTRPTQNNDTQEWIVIHLGNDEYTIQQRSTGRYMDAHESGNDFSVVTRIAQNNDTQKWVFRPLGSNMYTIQQKSTGRYVDAYESGNDFSAVTRAAQNNDTQKWVLTPIGGVYTIQQKSTDRYVDAHESGNDFSVVTRPTQNNDTQEWIVIHLGNDEYTIQQKSTDRYVDAHESGNDFSVVTRMAQNNDTQRWIIK